jgi:molecular chaperone DnaJ
VCQGLGVESRSETTTLTIPAGVSHGEQMCLPGLGHAGTRSAAPGDLYVTVQVAPHPVFRRDGDDLLLTVPVAVHEAALGARFDIPTPDGTARLRVPPGTQSGQRFRLRGRGVPSMRSGTRGDLIAEVRIVLPAVLDQRSRELLREYGLVNTEDVRAGLWRDASAS